MVFMHFQWTERRDETKTKMLAPNLLNLLCHRCDVAGWRAAAGRLLQLAHRLLQVQGPGDGQAHEEQGGGGEEGKLHAVKFGSPVKFVNLHCSLPVVY